MERPRVPFSGLLEKPLNFPPAKSFRRQRTHHVPGGRIFLTWTALSTCCLDLAVAASTYFNCCGIIKAVLCGIRLQRFGCSSAICSSLLGGHNNKLSSAFARITSRTYQTDATIPKYQPRYGAASSPRHGGWTWSGFRPRRFARQWRQWRQ